MTNETRPAILQELEDAHEKYLQALKERLPPDAAEYHQKNSREHFELLLKEAKENEYKEEFMRESIQMILSGIDDIEEDEEAILKGLCSPACFEALLRSYATATIVALAKTRAEGNKDNGGVISEILTKKVTETVIEMIKTANSSKSKLEAHKAVHNLVRDATGFMKLIEDSVNNGNYEVIDSRSSPNKDEYN